MPASEGIAYAVDSLRTSGSKAVEQTELSQNGHASGKDALATWLVARERGGVEQRDPPATAAKMGGKNGPRRPRSYDNCICLIARQRICSLYVGRWMSILAFLRSPAIQVCTACCCFDWRSWLLICGSTCANVCVPN